MNKKTKQTIFGAYLLLPILLIGLIILLLVQKSELKDYALQLEEKVVGLELSTNELNQEVSMLECETFDLESQLELKETSIKENELKLIEPFKETDKMNYYLAYKSITQEEPTIYSSFTQEDIDLLHNIVEVEAEAGGFLEKANVASVILNRLNTNHMGADTLEDVLLKGGFSSIWSPKFNNIEISEDTILACEYVFEIEDTTNGCMYFESCNYMAFDSFATYMFTDDIGHKFYKE